MVLVRTTFFIPDGLDLKQLLTDRGLNSLCSNLMLDKLHYVIDHLYLCVVIKKRKRAAFNPLHSQVLAEVLGTRDAPEVKKTLVELGVIEVQRRDGRETYEPGKQSKQYRFTERYRNARFYSVPIRSQAFAAHLDRKLTGRFERIVGNNAVMRLVARSIQDLDYDVEKARLFLNEFNFKTVDSENAYTYAVQCFEDKHWVFTADQRGRLYHNLTQMARKLRRFASYKGQELFAADVSACQPCLLSLLYEDDCDEKRRYIEIIKSDTFYAFLNKRLKQPYNLSDEDSKGQFKEEVFHRILYGSNWAKPTEMSQVFASEFPILANLVREAKRNHRRDLPLRLQKIESDIVINDVASEFIRSHQGEDFCLITIHDCLITTAEYVEECVKRLRIAFRNRLGFEPTVKIKAITVLDHVRRFPPNNCQTDRPLAA
jgi:hypothetical protein